MSFNDLKINDEKVPEGQSVRIIRDTSSWWVQPASKEAYLIASIIITLAIAAAFLIAG